MSLLTRKGIKKPRNAEKATQKERLFYHRRPEPGDNGQAQFVCKDQRKDKFSGVACLLDKEFMLNFPEEDFRPLAIAGTHL